MVTFNAAANLSMIELQREKLVELAKLAATNVMHLYQT